jgi:thiamine-phosphate pyrophosphorylase
MMLPQPPLLVISDRGQARRPLIEIAAAAFAGGCRWFSLREKDLPAEQRRALLAELVALGRRYRATVMAHDDIEAVLATGADGVHLPGGGDAAAARERLPRGLIGVSTHAAAEAAAAPGPIIALAGITPDNAASCLAAGARGIAVMGEVMRAVDPEEIVRRLIAALAVK